MPKLLDHNSFCEDLKEVTSIKIMDKKKFNSNGLFSEQIFGPVKNYTCQCGIYHGVFRSGGTCDDCGVDIVNSSERRRRFAKIFLPFPVVNPIFYDLLVSLGGTYLKDAIDDLMKKETSILYWHDEEEEYRITEVGKEPAGCKKWRKLEAIEELVTYVTNVYVDDGNLDWEIIKSNLDLLFLHQVIVLPPELRPATSRGNKNNQVVDEINRYYVQILTKKEIMKGTIIDIERDDALFYNYFRQLQKDVNELYTHILEKLSKKEGLIRGNILGKRIDFSGRAVIVPDPTLTLGYCSLPYTMVLELYKLQIAKKLVELSKFKLLNESIDFVDDCINYKKTVLFKICEEITADEVCILNRQPSLHRLSMLAFNINVNLDNVIKIHPLSCPPFNADFDGDQMAVYIPITEDTKREAREKLLINKNLTNPSNGSLTTTPSQDIILGIYALTNNDFKNLRDEVDCKGDKVLKGMEIFNTCFPPDFPLINEIVNEKVLIIILNEIKKRYTWQIASKVLDSIKKIGFKYSTLIGSTMSLQSCRIENADEMRDAIYAETGSIRDQVQRISGAETQALLKEKFKYSHLIESGARGSWDQVRQIVLSRGFISNFKGQILPVPIKNSLLKGLDEQEFFNSTYGCRKGLLDVALNTGSSGYLSRKLIFTCANLQIDDIIDCGTDDTLQVYIPENDEKKARMLIGKHEIINGNINTITLQNYMDIIGKTIHIRSPILCKNPNICKTCYGEHYTNLNSRFIGVIAAQSLGECNTQLVLRTFHTSGVAEIKDDTSEDMSQQDIINELSRASKALHQFKNVTYMDLVDNLYSIYNSSRSINHVHFECVVAQLMWKGFQKWRLMDGRDKIKPEFHSVQTVPSYESWLLSLAFSNPKKSILRGIIYSGQYSGVMDKILKGEMIT